MYTRRTKLLVAGRLLHPHRQHLCQIHHGRRSGADGGGNSPTPPAPYARSRTTSGTLQNQRIAKGNLRWMNDQLNWLLDREATADAVRHTNRKLTRAPRKLFQRDHINSRRYKSPNHRKDHH